MSLWTPGGEVPVNRSGPEPSRPPEPDPMAAGATGFVDGPSLDDLSPEERAQAEAMIEQMADVQRQIAGTPAAQLVANHAMGFYELAAIKLENAVLRFGRMYFREISGNQVDFGLPYGNAYTLAFSRVLYGREVLVAYNVSEHARSDSVVVDRSIHGASGELRFLYGGEGTVRIEASDDDQLRYVRLDLAPHQFVILE